MPECPLCLLMARRINDAKEEGASAPWTMATNFQVDPALEEDLKNSSICHVHRKGSTMRAAKCWSAVLQRAAEQRGISTWIRFGATSCARRLSKEMGLAQPLFKISCAGRRLGSCQFERYQGSGSQDLGNFSIGCETHDVSERSVT